MVWHPSVNPHRHTLPVYYGSGHLLQSEFIHNAQHHSLAEYGRDSLHREISRTQGALTERTEYDALGRVTAKLSRGDRAGYRGGIARHYHYNLRNQLQTLKLTLGQGEGTFDYGESQTVDYHYDEAGQVLARYRGGEPETWQYDIAGNLLNDTPVAWNNRVTRAGSLRYDYDEFGRMQRRTSLLSGMAQHFHYDSDSRVVAVDFVRHPRYRRVCYAYDALGRRTGKTLTHVQPCEPDREVTFHWQGMRLCGEQATHQALSYHFYHENSYTPLARFDCGALPGEELYFVHAEANGMPSLLSDAGGRIVWQPLKSGLFGRVMREKSTLSPYAAGQNLRFAGQYHDEETGLHYNTLRYYDPESGRFTQPDPVGLAGGINLYAYAPNPISGIDPLGLSGSGLVNGIPQNPGIVRRFMSKTEYKNFLKNGFEFNPADPRGGISVTSVKVDPKNPDAIKRSTGALGADYYVDIDTTNKTVELKGKTKGGVMDWKIKDNVHPQDIVNRGKVRKC